MDLEQALRNDIPLAEAASFFLKLKTAESVDAPLVPSGQQFALPVEQVLGLMAQVVESEFTTMLAYKAYAQSLRDLSHFAIAAQFDEHGDKELEHAEFLLRRMSVLGGPIQLHDIAAPMASVDPAAIIDAMVSLEQAGLAKWRELHAALGEDPTKYQVEQYMTDELEHLDELEQLRSVSAAPADAVVSPGAAVQTSPEVAEAVSAKQAQGLAPLPEAGQGKLMTAQPPPSLPPAAVGQHPKVAAAIQRVLTAVRPKLPSSLPVKPGGTVSLKSLAGQVAPKAAPVPTFSFQSLAKSAAALKPALASLQLSPDMQAYVADERAGMAAEQQGEAEFYRQKMQEAVAQMQAQQMQAQQASQQAGQLEQQVAASQAQQQQYQQMIAGATQQAVAARDETLQQQQAAAAMRMAYQQLRGTLLNVASQEPPSTDMLMEQAQADEATPGPAAPQAPADQAAAAAGAPNAVPPEGAPPNAAPGAGVEPMMQAAQPASNVGVKAASIEDTLSGVGKATLNLIKTRGPHALVGATLGGFAEAAYQAKSTAPLREKVRRLQQLPNRGFGQAMDLAQAKARLALAQVSDAHPNAALAAGMATGAIEGALSGPAVMQQLRDAHGHINDLRLLAR